MTLYAINLGIVTLLFFVAGMIKPKWPLFFMKKPTRFIILMVTPVLVMITLTMYGEGVKRSKEKKAMEAAPAKSIPAPAPVPVPVPVPDPAPNTPGASQ